jgi:hypothetical protein
MHNNERITQKKNKKQKNKKVLQGKKRWESWNDAADEPA